MSKIKLNHSGGNAVSLNPPTDAPGSADVAFKLPTTVGTAGQVLMSDGSGNLSWTDNTPMWLVKTGSNITVASETQITVPLATEIFDTDNAFNTSTYTFTVPAGKGGKYWLYHQVRLNSNPDTANYIQGDIFKNGTQIFTSVTQFWTAQNNRSTMAKQGWVEELAAGDTLIQKFYHTADSNATLDDNFTFFGGYRLIGG